MCYLTAPSMNTLAAKQAASMPPIKEDYII